MASEFQLKQAAVDALYAMLRGKRPQRFNGIKAQVAIDVLREMREAKEDQVAPLQDFVQDLLMDTAIEINREKLFKGKDHDC